MPGAARRASTAAAGAASPTEPAAATVQALVDLAVGNGYLDPADRLWAYNSLLEAVGATGPAPDEAWALGEAGADGATSALGAPAAPTADTVPGVGPSPATPAPLDLDAALAEVAEVAVANGAADDTSSGRDRAAMRVMGLLTPRPSEVAARVALLATTDGPRAATNWFYKLSCDVGYVRRSAIARNVRWEAATRWGPLEITINLSKPEKDPREIAAAGAARPVRAAYPACQLCVQNEGYPGRPAALGAHPARQNLRIVPIELGGERWGLQYSPYAYFDEHCIAMSARHRPMHIDRAALACLLDFVDLWPHYFIGSNADLPIVGGSILSHDHFQGGAHEFPMMRAPVDGRFGLPGFPQVEGEVLVWPLTVLRLRSSCRDALLDAATHVVDAWRAWSDEPLGIVARTPDGTPHNTVTPVVRRVDAAARAEAGGAAGADPGTEPAPGAAPADDRPCYEAYLALRCNMTSDEHPLGVFHPHAEWHHIKKENIGLIEVMGLAVLPARLVDELAAVRAHLLVAADTAGAAAGAEAAGVEAAAVTRTLADALAADPLAAPHAAWALDIWARRGSELSPATVEGIVREEVGVVFAHVLEDAGVYKWDAPGRAGLARFLASL